jgi:uncharacterized membrane protein
MSNLVKTTTMERVIYISSNVFLEKMVMIYDDILMRIPFILSGYVQYSELQQLISYVPYSCSVMWWVAFVSCNHRFTFP